ncbi:MAG: hypothetical protein ACYDCL_20355 [Myxococcales bacterium]
MTPKADDARRRIREVLERRSPGLVAQFDALAGEIDHDFREAVWSALVSELGSNLLPNGEPNERGLAVDELITEVNHWRLKGEREEDYRRRLPPRVRGRLKHR